jgi:hypothetical protein
VRSVIFQLVAAHYPSVASELLKPLLELLLASRRACGGDVDKFLILLVVATRVAEHPEFAALTPHHLAEAEVETLPSRGTNVRSIADSTDIPKETVRRKVSELIEAGWLERRGRDLTLTSRAYQMLSPVRQKIELLAARNWQTASGLLARA